jgi:hypothetical protein
MSQEITFELTQRQMNFLEKHLNEEARCVYWNSGNPVEVSGTLTKIVPFDRIVIGNRILSFVDHEGAIEEIYINGNLVYCCPSARGYKGCFAHDHFAIVAAQQELLGKSVRLDALNTTYENASADLIANSGAMKGGRGFHRDEKKEDNVINTENQVTATGEISEDIGRAR